MRAAPSPSSYAAFDLPPAPRRGLEEIAASGPKDWGQAAAFALLRADGTSETGLEDHRPLVFVAPKLWRRERGGLFARGLQGLGIEPDRLVLVRTEREEEALWAQEEALKSGAVKGAIAAVERASFVATRRLDFAAREGRALAVLLRAGPAADLSAARLRWRISPLASAPHPFDPKAPGAPRLRAELVRRRDGPLGAWELEQDHETHRLRLAAGLADHGLVQGRRARAA
jgi:protein ImuA